MIKIVEEEYRCETCCKCYVKFWMPTHIYLTALSRADEFWFWCPNGHKQHYQRRKPKDDDEDEEEGEAEIVRFPVIKGDLD